MSRGRPLRLPESRAMKGANHAAVRLSRPSKWRLHRIVVTVALAPAALAAVMCGGTTGRDGLQTDNGAEAGGGTADGSAMATDGSGGSDSGTFDVVVTYADRILPDVVAPRDSGAPVEAGYPWPTCPPFLLVGPNGETTTEDGGPVPFGSEINQIPAIAVDGGEIPAPDGSACATYGWLGSPAIDNCVTSQFAGAGGAQDFSFLPPCNWCQGAGVASVGPGAGLKLYDLCINLYVCALQTGCGALPGAAACLCGDAGATECILDAGGPCAAEEIAALQVAPGSLEPALENYNDLTPLTLGNLGYCGSLLNSVFQNAITGACFSLLDGGGTP
jgi:hypothetical protein